MLLDTADLLAGRAAELVLEGHIVSAVEDKGDYFTDFALQHQD
jgi:hypothetical protein